MKHLLALLAAVCCACATTPSAPEKPLPPFEPKGEVVYRGGNASFDENHVRGPIVNVSRRANGDWAGTLNGQALDVSVTEKRLVGSYLNLTLDRNEKGIVITGLWMEGIHRFQVSNEEVMVRLPRSSITLFKSGPGEYTGPNGVVRFVGEAGKPVPPWPQIGFALLATFVATQGR